MFRYRSSYAWLTVIIHSLHFQGFQPVLLSRERQNPPLPASWSSASGSSQISLTQSNHAGFYLANKSIENQCPFFQFQEREGQLRQWHGKTMERQVHGVVVDLVMGSWHGIESCGMNHSLLFLYSDTVGAYLFSTVWAAATKKTSSLLNEFLWTSQ